MAGRTLPFRANRGKMGTRGRGKQAAKGRSGHRVPSKGDNGSQSEEPRAERSTEQAVLSQSSDMEQKVEEGKGMEKAALVQPDEGQRSRSRKSRSVSRGRSQSRGSKGRTRSAGGRKGKAGMRQSKSPGTKVARKPISGSRKSRSVSRAKSQSRESRTRSTGGRSRGRKPQRQGEGEVQAGMIGRRLPQRKAKLRALEAIRAYYTTNGKVENLDDVERDPDWAESVPESGGDGKPGAEVGLSQRNGLRLGAKGLEGGGGRAMGTGKRGRSRIRGQSLEKQDKEPEGSTTGKEKSRSQPTATRCGLVGGKKGKEKEKMSGLVGGKKGKEKEKMSEESKDRMKLLPGETFAEKYIVLKKLGQGGFGAVYEAEDMDTKLHWALKVEVISKRDQVLKVEVEILKRLQGSKHAVSFCTCGRTSNMNYLLMGIVGQNLGDLKRSCPMQKFTCCTSVRLAIQCLEGIEELHRVGFLHRDIKPSNFAMGKQMQRKIVYILDFGLSRRYKDSKNKLRPPRKSAGFRGTTRYCSLAAHRLKELGRQDDLMSWMYMLIEFIRGQLPWRNVNDRNTIKTIKKTISRDVLLRDCPEETHKILKYLERLGIIHKLCDTFSQVKFKDDPLEYSMEPTYATIKECLIYSMEAPFDWMEGGEHYKHHAKARRQGAPDTTDSGGTEGEEEDPTTVTTRGRTTTADEDSTDENNTSEDF